MYLLRHRVCGPVFSAWSKPALAILLAALSSGCATRSDYAAANVGAPPPQHVAAAPQDIEDDGLPVQRPPLVRSVQQPDDPSEPYSRNYGTPPPVLPARSAPPSGPAPARAAAAAPTAPSRQPLIVATGAD